MDQILAEDSRGEKVRHIREALEKLDGTYTDRYFKVLEDPVGLVTTLITELVEDCCCLSLDKSLTDTDDIQDELNE